MRDFGRFCASPGFAKFVAETLSFVVNCNHCFISDLKLTSDGYIKGWLTVVHLSPALYPSIPAVTCGGYGCAHCTALLLPVCLVPCVGGRL